MGWPARVIDFEAGVAIARTIYAIARSSPRGPSVIVGSESGN
jgi:hypothetical protein